MTGLVLRIVGDGFPVPREAKRLLYMASFAKNKEKS